MIAIVAALALVQAQLPTAQAPPSSSSATVVVSGHPEEARRQVRRLTRIITPVDDNSRPLARFSRPICPTITGIAPEAVSFLLARLRADAATADIAFARDGCRPNLLLAFVDNGQATVRALARQSRGLSNVPSEEISALERDSGPIHQWSFTSLRSRDGDEEQRSTTTGEDAPELKVRDASVLHLSTRMDLTGAILLVDQPATMGKTLGQIADYAAMRLFAQTIPRRRGPAPDTILSLFDPAAAPPKALTEFDRGYLHSLYQGPGTETRLGKVQHIAAAINHGR